MWHFISKKVQPCDLFLQWPLSILHGMETWLDQQHSNNTAHKSIKHRHIIDRTEIQRLEAAVREVSSFLQSENFIIVHTKARIRTVVSRPIQFTTQGRIVLIIFLSTPISLRQSLPFVFKPDFLCISSPHPRSVLYVTPISRSFIQLYINTHN